LTVKGKLHELRAVREPLAGTGIPSRDASAIAGHRAFVIEVKQSVVEVSFRRNIDTSGGFGKQPPGAKHAAPFRKEIPVREWPVVGEDNEPRHEIGLRTVWRGW
jgi:hypothetical protein